MTSKAGNVGLLVVTAIACAVMAAIASHFWRHGTAVMAIWMTVASWGVLVLGILTFMFRSVASRTPRDPDGPRPVPRR
jgi:CHASE2 domain-containing sensor protein